MAKFTFFFDLSVEFSESIVNMLPSSGKLLFEFHRDISLKHFVSLPPYTLACVAQNVNV